MHKQVKCPACTSQATEYNYGDGFLFYECPICGRFELSYPLTNCLINRNHLAAYLVYHSYRQSERKGTIECRYHTVRDKEVCDKFKREYERGNYQHGYPIHMDQELIKAWYPSNFAERIDRILLYLAEHTEHIGQRLTLVVNQLMSVLFVDKQRLDIDPTSEFYGQWVERESVEYIEEANYMLRFLKEQGYIETIDFTVLKKHEVLLTPKGYARVDELQKNTSNGRNVLVAMSFHDTDKLREAIREGITAAGYVAIFIDEVQHNDFITPELLKHIRDSRFVVVDLTHQNNGAYFEEGYAMGLGKPVIQLCRRGVQLHFDIAQKNTIMWENETDIPQKLCNRIKATIE